MHAPRVDFLIVMKHHTPWVLLAVLLALIALGLAIGALVAKRERAGVSAGVGAIIAAAGAGVGLGGALVTLRMVAAIWTMMELNATELRELTAEGYAEAAYLVAIGGVAVALPLLLCIAGAIRAGRGRALTIVGVVATAATVAVGFWLTSPARGQERLDAHMAAWVTRALDDGSCDPCLAIASAIDLLGSKALDARAPGALEQAKACIDGDLKSIEGGVHPERGRVCADAPLPPREDGSRVAPKPLRAGDKTAALQALLESPLLVDEEQRRAIGAAIERAEEEAKPKPKPPPESASATRGKAAVAAPSVVGGTISNASVVIARMRGRFRRCYQAGLEQDPNMEGSVTLTAKVDAEDGAVLAVGGGGGGSIQRIVPCLKAVVRAGGFAKPDGADAIVAISINFERGDDPAPH